MPHSRRIMVIGLDGADWETLRPRMEDGRMPNLQRLACAGVADDLESVYTPETPVAWSSFMTGKNPGKHGIFDFVVHDPTTRRDRPVNSRIRTGRTIWDYLTDHGKTSLVLNLPTTYPLSPIKGAMISCFLTPAGAKDYTYPIELAAELEQEYGPYPLYFKTMCYVSVGSKHHAKLLLDECHRMEEIKFNTAEKLFDRYQPDFTMLHIWGTDRLQHELWNCMDPSHPRYNRRLAKQFGPTIENYFTMIDERIGRLVSKLDSNDIAIVMSDHGMGATHYLIDQNSWLLREGFITLKNTLSVRLKRILWNLGITPNNAWRILTPVLKLAAFINAPPPEKVLRRSTGTINVPGMLRLDDVDWEKTKAYAPFGWSGIHINTKGIRPHGSVDPKDYAAIRDQIVARWQALKNPYTGELVGGPVPTNEEMYHGPFAPYGSDIMPLPLEQKYMPVCFFGFASKEPVYPNNTIPGNHRFEGIFLAYGKELNPMPIQPRARLIDLAPTILHLLGLPVPDDMDGRVLTELIGADALVEKPIQTVHVAAQEEERTSALTDAEEEEIREKLQGLGYL